MKTDRRNFLKLLGSTGLAAPLQRLQPTIDKARVAIAKRVIKILLPSNGVYVPQITGCAMVDFFLSMDHPQQIMPCGCVCTPEGDLIEGCEEEKRLKTILDGVQLAICRAANGGSALTWEEYKSFRDAVKFYIHHCRATVVRTGGELRAGRNARTGKEIRL
jgi:hypothetical protein